MRYQQPLAPIRPCIRGLADAIMWKKRSIILCFIALLLVFLIDVDARKSKKKLAKIDVEVKFDYSEGEEDLTFSCAGKNRSKKNGNPEIVTIGYDSEENQPTCTIKTYGKIHSKGKTDPPVNIVASENVTLFVKTCHLRSRVIVDDDKFTWADCSSPEIGMIIAGQTKETTIKGLQVTHEVRDGPKFNLGKRKYILNLQSVKGHRDLPANLHNKEVVIAASYGAENGNNGDYEVLCIPTLGGDENSIDVEDCKQNKPQIPKNFKNANFEITNLPKSPDILLFCDVYGICYKYHIARGRWYRKKDWKKIVSGRKNSVTNYASSLKSKLTGGQ